MTLPLGPGKMDFEIECHFALFPAQNDKICGNMWKTFAVAQQANTPNS